MNQVKFFIIILLIYFLLTDVELYRILCVFPWAFKSHNMLFQTLLKGLAKRGHQIDVISHYELVNPPKNYKTILNLAKLDIEYPTLKFDSIKETIDNFKDMITYVLKSKIGISVCAIMSHEKMQQVLRNPPNDPPYDLIITEADGVSCYYGLGPFLNIPLITITASKEFPTISRTVGNPLSTAFSSTHLLGKSEIKTFWDRLSNTILSMYNLYILYLITEIQTESMRKYLSSDLPPVREVEKMVALTIINTHHTIQGVRPTIPAFVEVGGIHIEEDESHLTGELKQWMDESNDGVVYLSLGTEIALEIFPKQTILSIYSSFAKFAPIRFLIKASKGEKFPPGLPKNAKTQIWIPQIPVLRHNNTRAFITHGGLHSLEEAIYFATPVIGIPLVADQYQNVEILVNKNIGIEIDFDKITEISLTEALTKILNYPKFSEAAKYHSRLFRDRPMSPMDTAIYWIEYIGRNGPQSLRSPAVDMPWWKVELLDVYGFLLLCFILTFYLILILVKIVIKSILAQKTKSQLKRD